jgi:hypothetical protein
MDIDGRVGDVHNSKWHVVELHRTDIRAPSATATAVLHGEHIRADANHNYIIDCRPVLAASRRGRSGGKGEGRKGEEEYWQATMGLTTLLTMAVLLFTVSQMMPKSASETPRLGRFRCFIELRQKL